MRRLRDGSSARSGAQLKHVEAPWGVIDKEAVIGKISAVAMMDLCPHDIREAHLPTSQFGERQEQPTLPLVSGVIDDDDVPAACLADPGTSDKAIRSWTAPCSMRSSRS
jgi:hypothetical protein